jgi:predicted dehydrogenase
VARLRVGVLGLSHDHVWQNLTGLAAGELGQLVAAADPDPQLRQRLTGTYGNVEVHATYDELLGRADVEAVFVFADNRTSAELGVRALGRGLPVMIEKPMAADLAGADALLAAERAAGVPLMINWPTAWRPALRHGIVLVHSGAVGRPVQLSYRGGHAGPRQFGCSAQFCDWLYDPTRNGGGVLIDYCGYGAILCRTILGQPLSVTAASVRLGKDAVAAEDNAIVVLRYPRALGLIEVSWTQVGEEPAFAMIVYGDSGTLIVHQPKSAREGQQAGTGAVQLVTAEKSELIVPPPLPADQRDGPTYFLTRVREGQAIEGVCAAEVGRDAQEVMAAALRSSATGQHVTLRS